jgi:uncharacterized OsmC-like protein
MTTDQRSARDRQSPLRKAYVDDPALAVTVKHVVSQSSRSTDTWHGVIATPQFPGAIWRYGIDAKVGGDDDLPNPGHLLCAALAACMESTTRAMAEHLDVTLDQLVIDVVGDVDARGCLAIDRTVRTGFRHIDVEVRLSPAAGTPAARLQTLLTLVEELCVTLDTLRNGVPIDVRSMVAS